MKRITARAALLLIAVLLLASCATQVSIPYTRPSEVNMGRYRNLAVASTVPYRGYIGPGLAGGWIPVDAAGFGVMIHPTWGSNTVASVASYATEQLWSTLSSSGYYNLLSPSQTDAILYAPVNVSRELRRMGYDAVMIPRIDAMNVDESIYTTVNPVTYYDPYFGGYIDDYEYEYHLRRRISITYTVTVVDTATERIVTTKTFSDSTSFTETFDPDWPSFNDSEYYFRRMIRDFQQGVVRLFIPTTAYYSVSLMDNNPALDAAAPAYDAAANGDFQTALSIFTSCWNTYSHAPSGYNAALMIAAQGRYDEAIDILRKVQAISPSGDIPRVISDLTAVSQQDKQAQAQMAAAAQSIVIPEEWRDDSIYEYLVR